MKESVRAARTEIAIKRQVAAVREIEGGERADELERLSGPARYPEVNALLQQELVADILEEIARGEASLAEDQMHAVGVREAAETLFGNRLGWSEGRQPYAPREMWADLGAAIHGEDDERVQELREPSELTADEKAEMGTANEEEYSESSRNPDFSFLSEEQVKALRDAGYATTDDVREATDEDLAALPHVGKVTVKKIREALAQRS